MGRFAFAAWVQGGGGTPWQKPCTPTFVFFSFLASILANSFAAALGGDEESKEGRGKMFNEVVMLHVQPCPFGGTANKTKVEANKLQMKNSYL